MSVIFEYHKHVTDILTEVFDKEAAAMEEAAAALAAANKEGRSIFGFGCNHAGLITLELFYRTGGMVTVNPIRAPGMMLELSPPTMTSEMELVYPEARVSLPVFEPVVGCAVLRLLEQGKDPTELLEPLTQGFSQFLYH